MSRFGMMAAVAAALVSAFALYGINYRSRQIASDNQRLEREIVRLKRDIQMMRAERTYLARPARLAPLARQLGMRPVSGDQFVLRSDLPLRNVER